MHSFNSPAPILEDERLNHNIHDTYEVSHNDSSLVSDGTESSQEDCGYEKAYYDQYDIQLKPRQKLRQVHKPKASVSTQLTTILLPIRRKSRRHCLFPTEVLHLLCSHLSQATLRCTVSLVCKEWSNVSKQYIQRTGVWKNATTDQENQLLKQLPTLSSLECYLGIQGLHNAYDRQLLMESLLASWDRFTTTITASLSASDKDQPTDSAKPKCLIHHLRRLVLKGPLMAYEVSFPLTSGRLRFLQSLELHMAMSTIPLFELLNNNPSLRELKIIGGRFQGSKLLSGDDEDHILEASDPVIGPVTAHFPRKVRRHGTNNRVGCLEDMILVITREKLTALEPSTYYL
ncbi:hypothetical protein BGZ72_001857 [Mortierella alpina]|nr:hypothetical protein BGZ72_001857 [Mortierella alpina]